MKMVKLFSKPKSKKLLHVSSYMKEKNDIFDAGNFSHNNDC